MPSPNRSLPLPQSPSGFVGKIFGKLMELTNADAYKKALQALEPTANDRFLEIGFGTGYFAEMLLANTSNTFVAGIDPTETMVQTAVNRLDRQGFHQRIDLRQGTDESLPWENDRFDGIVAIHCFQFWQDPDRSMHEIDRILCPHGRMVIVFRDHSNKAPDWLPNPLSRSGKEVELAIGLLETHGCAVREHSSAGSSRIIRADR
jgi:ubiquinone/menaquinone biosynthesis C-methylase UbiE